MTIPIAEDAEIHADGEISYADVGTGDGLLAWVNPSADMHIPSGYTFKPTITDSDGTVLWSERVELDDATGRWLAKKVGGFDYVE